MLQRCSCTRVQRTDRCRNRADKDRIELRQVSFLRRKAVAGHLTDVLGPVGIIFPFNIAAQIQPPDNSGHLISASSH